MPVGARALVGAPVSHDEASVEASSRRALGSAKEAKATLRVLRSARAVDLHRGVAGIELLDRVCALDWRLIHQRRR